MDSKKYIVYKHQNYINNKIYIGITSEIPERRWRKNGQGYKSNEYFYAAIKKYSWQNFSHEILFENLSRESACKKEQELIAFYKSNDRKYGYNLTNGGDSGKEFSIESCKKMSKAKKNQVPWNKGKKLPPLSDEHKEKLRKASSGKNNPMYGVRFCGKENHRFGKHCSEETKRKIAATKIGKNLIEEHKLKIGKSLVGKMAKEKNPHYGIGKKVICINTNEVFNTINEASEKKQICVRSIINLCKGKRKEVKGLQFKYYDEGLVL